MCLFRIKAIQNLATVGLANSDRKQAYYFSCVNLHMLFSSQRLYKSGERLKDNKVDKCVDKLFSQCLVSSLVWDLETYKAEHLTK